MIQKQHKGKECKHKNWVWAFADGTACDDCGKKHLERLEQKHKESLLEKAQKLNKHINNVERVVDSFDIKELYELVEAILNGQISLLSFGPTIGSTKQGSYSAFTSAIRRLYYCGYIQLNKYVTEK